MSARWPWWIAGGAGLGIGIVALSKWFEQQDAWAQGVESNTDSEEGNAMTTSALLSWPVTGRVASPYGTRINPITHEAGQMHNGIDIAVPAGTIVRAPADGTVKSAWEDKIYGGGYSLVMVHDGELAGLQTGYAHLRDWLVTAGARVKRGDPIAHSGGVKGEAGAGSSTGAHLHLTVRRDGVTVDPIGELEPVGGSVPSIV